MARQPETGGTLLYTSKRLLTARNPRFKARYRGLGQVPQPGTQGTLEHFLTERYCLFTPNRGRLLVGHIHHLPWPLQPAEAEIIVNEIPEAHRITLPNQAPVLHFAKLLEVYIWPLREDR